MEEYIAVYGKDKWALSTYESDVTKINTYIIPLIGDTKLRDINTRFVEQFYQ
nr:N-terminal phage integrase SAM-like domain-containing protein [Blautia faecis]